MRPCQITRLKEFCHLLYGVALGKGDLVEENLAPEDVPEEAAESLVPGVYFSSADVGDVCVAGCSDEQIFAQLGALGPLPEVSRP